MMFWARILGLGITMGLLLSVLQLGSADAKKPYTQLTFQSAELAARHLAVHLNKAQYGAYRDAFLAGFRVSDWSVVNGTPYRYRTTFDPSRMHFKLMTREYATPGNDYLQVAKADLWVEQIKTGPAQGRWRILSAKKARIEQGGYNGDFQIP
jgi:hypothetical protein